MIRESSGSLYYMLHPPARKKSEEAVISCTKQFLSIFAAVMAVASPPRKAAVTLVSLYLLPMTLE
jgi:hypothetical protein